MDNEGEAVAVTLTAWDLGNTVGGDRLDPELTVPGRHCPGGSLNPVSMTGGRAVEVPAGSLLNNEKHKQAPGFGRDSCDSVASS